MLAAMGPPGGGRTFITARLIRHFNVIAYTELDRETINVIFTTLIDHFYKKFDESIKAILPKVI
jgi:dynein heavy chain